MVAYVIYRFATDGKKSKNEAQHSNYPVTSNPSDKMFPNKNDKLGWASYILLTTAFFLFLVNFIIMLIEDEVSILLSTLFGGFLITGLVVQGISKVTNSNAQ